MKAALLGLVLLAAFGLAALAQTGTADRLYVMDCGHNAATTSRAGRPASMSASRSSFPTIAT